MPALTPSFLMDLESRMSVITERAYNALNANVWWPNVARLRGSVSRREVITWLLSTAMIKDQGAGGNIHFDDIVSQTTEFEHKYSGAGLKLQRAQLEDTDGNGVQLASQWSGDIGSYMGYWPQKQATHLLKNGHTAALYTAYTLKAFFATDHPLNPFMPAAGTYANLLTGGNAFPIDDSVDIDDALVNLGKLCAHIATVKQANGEDPRGLRVEKILCSPRMFPRVVQLTNAKFLAQVAGSGAGSSDVEAVIKSLGFAMPVQCDELAGFESDTTYFVSVKQIADSELGALVYSEREAFRINYYGTMDSALLNRSQELEWHCLGRNTIQPGHPFLLYKCKAT